MVAKDQEILTVDEAAAFLRVTRDTMRRWLRTGRIRGTSLGDRAGWRIYEADVRAFLADNDNSEFRG